MIFGRLDVFWPDGQFQSYMLEGDTVSVGRSPGNTITLDSDTISRYHFSIVNQDDSISITDLDSENGTFVDGIRLQSNAPRELDSVEEIQAGHLRIIYQPLDEDPTLPVPPLNEDDTLRVEREDANFRLALDMGRVDVWPAASSSVELAITNTGEDNRRYGVDVKGINEKWVRINRPELELNPNETGYVLVNFKPPRHPDIAPRPYDVTIQVEPIDNPTIVLEAPVTVNIRTYSGFGMALANPVIDAGDNFRLYLHNQGSGELAVTVRGIPLGNADLSFNLPSAPLVLAPGQRMQVNGTVTSSRALIGSTETHQFDLQVHAENAAGFLAVARGTVRMQPRVPLWGAITAVGILISVLVIGLLAASGALLPPAQPVISNLAVNTAQVAQGDILEITWQSEDVSTVRVYVAGEEIDSLDGDISTAAIDTSAYNGSVLVRLEGETRGVIAEASTDVFVYIPATINSFTVTPDSLVRDVVTALTISWDAPGAIRTRLTGLENFTNAPLQSSYETASNTLEGIGGIPGEDLSITLFAEDPGGNEVQQTIDIVLSNPTCTAQGEISLRQGPNILHQVIGTVPAGETVVVNAQDAEAGWLRIVLPGDNTGWGEKAGFVCSEIFAVEELRTELDVPPLPTITPTPTVAVTPLPTVIPATPVAGQ